MALGYIAGREAGEMVKESRMLRTDENQVTVIRRDILLPMEGENGVSPILVKQKVQDIFKTISACRERTLIVITLIIY